MKRSGSPDSSKLRAAIELANQSEEVTEEAWSKLNSDELVAEVDTCRSHIAAVAENITQIESESKPTNEVDSLGGGLAEISINDVDPSEWQVPPHCIPILADVTKYNWSHLYNTCQFDVIMMDPPWVLATANPTRGVALGYGQLTNKDILSLPIQNLQTNGLLFIWVINSSYDFAIGLFNRWGYKIVDEIVWVKLTVNRRLAKSHGYYLQHAKEVCLVGLKGEKPKNMRESIGSDIILSERRGQSQKPEEIYELVEELVPNGKYLEIFARKNNLRNFWVSVGNEVCGNLSVDDVKLTESSAK